VVYWLKKVEWPFDSKSGKNATPISKITDICRVWAILKIKGLNVQKNLTVSGKGAIIDDGLFTL
jgi:hypothetical protein